MKELSIIFAEVAFIGIDFFDGVFGMATGGDTEGKIGAVVMRRWRHFRGQDETVVGIDGGMFFKSEVRDVVLFRPVGIEISGEFKEVPVFIEVTRWFLSFLYFLFQFFFADGMTGRFYQAGVDGYAFVDG